MINIAMVFIQTGVLSICVCVSDQYFILASAQILGCRAGKTGNGSYLRVKKVDFVADLLGLE